MTPLQLIAARHTVRRYADRPLPPATASALETKIKELNEIGRLHIQLIQNEPRAFKSVLAYGSFSGVRNYFVMAGEKSADLDERIGYYGEQLVLFAQALGLNTCWVGLTYSKIKNTYSLAPNEKIGCYIAVGYGQTQGAGHKTKRPEQVCSRYSTAPEWFRRGVQAALLAPTAVNQQKFHFEFVGGHKVRATRQFSLAGYTKMDLGIAKCHFELGAQPETVEWV